MVHIGAVRKNEPAGITITNLSKDYETSRGIVQAMAPLSFSVKAGEFICVVGASGCGKSTLLRLVAGFEKPTTGSISVDETEVNGPSPERGVVFQDYGLFPWLTVWENIAWGPRQAHLNRELINERCDKYIKAVGLERFAKRYPNELSGGMQQRVSIARVLANEPSVMLMDEPFGALDALTRSGMQTELFHLHKEIETTVLFITHSIEEAVVLADRVVVMTGGAAKGVPGHIRDVVPIDLPEDRDVTGEHFNELERRITELVNMQDE
ncbi:MAG: ABC transporter ATP-binding protein [Bifidobacterium tibiigranuli]|jgi:ABC-type nitrate/sulfonate/bicarbonate transport system ATPase subunit|nr:ABC transporter ATP-binding protein [Bifidobacterium tibiigranuli]MCI1797724.1 ABC transporter ATP-binding protein [Bifidobacterium tibiigranuli]